MKIEIIEYSEKIITELAKLRVDAYENDDLINHSIYPNGWVDELDKIGIHLIVRDANRIIGSSRLNEIDSLFDIPWLSELSNSIESNGKAIYLSRLVVHPSYKGRGIGRLLDDEGYRLAKERHARSIYVVAKNWRIDYLFARGFVKIHDIKTTNAMSHIEKKCLLCKVI